MFTTNFTKDLPLKKSVLVSCLDQKLADTSKWDCKIISFGATSLDQPILCEYNLCEYLHPRYTPNKRPPHSMSYFEFDHNTFVGSSKDMVLLMKQHITVICRNAGFNIYVCHSVVKDVGTRLARISFKCSHNRDPVVLKKNEGTFTEGLVQMNGIKKQNVKVPHGHQRNSKNMKSSNSTGKRSNSHGREIRKTSSQRPNCCENKCDFQFKIFCCAHNQRWYLGINTTNDGTTSQLGSHHNGHHYLRPELSQCKIDEASNEETELIKQCTTLGLTESFIALLLEARSDRFGYFSKKQISYIRSKILAIDAVCNHRDKQSSAEKLIEKFDNMIKNGEDMQYVALVHSSNDGYLIKMPPGRPPKKINGAGGYGKIV